MHPHMRVRAGARLLDEHFRHAKWPTELHSKLIMEDPTRCIIGQLFGRFEMGLRVLRLNPNTAMKYGFLADCINSDRALQADVYHEYGMLQRAWEIAIKDRT